MMDNLAVSIPDIRALVAERQRFDDWLSALEGRRGETPARVFDRVHADYVSRRNSVIDGLHTHVAPLESLEEDLSNRLQGLETQLAEREDERAEALLRTAVGEFDAERWESTRHEVEASIAALGSEREALIAEADDVRSLLASARFRPADAGAPPQLSAAPVAASAIAPADDKPELVSANIAAAIAHADPAAVEHSVELDDEGTPAAAPLVGASNDAEALFTTDPFHRAVPNVGKPQRDPDPEFSVTDTTFEEITSGLETSGYPSRPAAATGRTAQSESERDREADAAIDALGAPTNDRNSSALDDIDVYGEPGAATRSGRGATGAPAPRGTDDPFGQRGPAADAGRPAPKADAFDDLAFLRSVTEPAPAAPSATGTPPSTGARSGATTEQAKTLRCTECGTMNFPTEWYCERCGGELAAF